ncbi:hypothetical protein [Polyangium aurulentum]|uniref:hypothetical protein n=1 Tax=Polyangium aurulentum TaxID=2567896 RepID=UPI0010AE86A1|nr:hypothetical protein [Polyangium aurulentum]UQA56613.1 hypothetical protein E8A73_035690 [Polyangium aurulentum]
MTRVHASEVARIAAVLLLVVAAPTVGDIGSCGAPPDDLDPAKFFRAKAEVECERCVACDLATAACVRACNDPAQTELEVGCYPLVHDGEACLDAIEASPCSTFETFVADQGASIPTECNFCPPEAR